MLEWMDGTISYPLHKALPNMNVSNGARIGETAKINSIQQSTHAVLYNFTLHISNQTQVRNIL